ncbi:MAG: CpsD/CapB family tyrosine-protein kinase [Chloroflexota bacterium]
MNQLVTIADPSSTQSEAYRTLRTNLSFYSLDQGFDTLVVTSPSPQDSAYLATANLAVTMAQGGKRTILVEADLRRPSIHIPFGLDAEPGLTDALLTDGAIPAQKTTVEGLSVLTSGARPPNPADLLGSQKVDDVIVSLKAEYDLIIFNAPPVLAASDATVLGGKVNGVLLTVHSGQTRRDYAQKACEALRKANIRIIGAALIDAPLDTSIGEY